MRGAEGGVAGEEDVDDDAERPEVDGFRVSGLGARAGEDFAVVVLVGGGGSGGGERTVRGIRVCRRRWSCVWRW